jgi:ferritin-like metal-binding protein YciE
MIAAAQRVEHYEISSYGTARTIAEHLGYDDAAELLQQTLNEEGAADEKLTEICQSEILSAIPTEEAEEEEEERPAASTKKRSARAGG